MRKYFIGGAIILIIVIILVIRAVNGAHPPQQKIYQSSYTATNIQFPYLANSNTVDYFTGSAFAAYTLSSHTTKTLSPQFSLPTISAMRWSSTGVLFQASNSTPADDLWPAANNFELDPSEEYWWLYNFDTQQISLVNGGNAGATVTDARWVNGAPDLYDYVVEDAVMSSSGRTLFESAGDIAQLDYASPTQVIYQTTSSSPTVKAYNLTNGTTSTITSSKIKDITTASSGKYMVYVDHYNTNATGNTPGDLELLNLQTHKVNRIMKNYEGTTSFNSDSSLLISSRVAPAPSQLLRYNLTTAKLTALNNSSLDQNNAAASLWVINPSNYIVDSSSNLLTVFRDQPASQPIYSNYDYLIQGDIYQNGFEIHYRSDSGIDVYNIYISQNPYLQYQQAALQYIRSQKIDPNLINIKWYSDDGVTRPTYVDATVPTNYFSSETVTKP